MNFPSRETVERLRQEFPKGCRIVLDEMRDPFTRIPSGTQGVCRGVDDAGSVMASWDCGSSLSVAYGEDRCHRVATEAEAKISIDYIGQHQKADDFCPRCGCKMPGDPIRYALSRRANSMICSSCGQEEAFEDAGLKTPKLLLTSWWVLKEAKA